MKKKTGFIIAIVFLIVFTFLFFNKMAQKAMNSNNPREYVQPEGKDVVDNVNGYQIYQQKCIACHQANGMGIAGTFPPLKGSDFLKNSTKKRIIEQVMNGSEGELVVNNVKYNSSMPPQISNKSEAVAVANYILNAWGNRYGKATPLDAKGIKSSNKGGRHMMMRRGMKGMSGCN